MKILVAIFAFNEGEKIKNTIRRFPINYYKNYDLIICDDGSTDGSILKLETKNILILRNKINQGIGYTMKILFNYAIENKYDITVIMAGNDKDRASEIDRLIAPILNNKADFVQGSRYLKGGHYDKMPLYRHFATRFLHPLIFSFITQKWITDSTNGFRAINTSILKNKKVNFMQKWLNEYELEPYIFYKAIKLNYRCMEVPVSKIYPSKELGYTKMKPIIGWWSILRPLIYLPLKIKK